MHIPETSPIFAVIGGTGVTKIEGLERVDYDDRDTPFGKPSSTIDIFKLGDAVFAFLARHGPGHVMPPSNIPFRANFYALKRLGVKYVLSFGACGSLSEYCHPQDVVIADEFLDFTKKRETSFFTENGVIGHIPFGDPVYPWFVDFLTKTLNDIQELKEDHIRVHKGGTYVCIEGPAFSSRAESHMYRKLGGTVIGMTAIPEAKLARECEMEYGLVAFITDYDCWKQEDDGVTVDSVVETLQKNSRNAQHIISATIKKLNAAVQDGKAGTKAHTILDQSVFGNIPDDIPESQKLIINRFLNDKQNDE
eukprot:gb/GECH01006812.1/.p1 GENE.gb/GECH01006812.1/~~gb/GECH01006812.1/.p1  ORF type:complete len:307 (+),score=78.64 gb/GECH01006812.1/:1-921(+)